ncbi:MAG TPA: recombination regulator RecX, partial [Elusimicrobia bacterium]|nr:recombination regulator RecX [Elusimicrobiota bacterium]
ELARKKMAQMKGVEPRKAYNRLMGFIARRGFRVETAREVLRRVRGLSEEEE